MLQIDELSALDLETAPLKPTDLPYALEPWRLHQNKAEITIASIRGEVNCTRKGTQLRDDLEKLKDKYVIAHNALFDAAWLIEEYGYNLVNNIKWLDSSLLSKWISNSGERISHSLINSCNRHISDHPRIEEFNDIKFQKVKPGEDYEYWLERNKLDTEMTLALFKTMWKKTPESMKRGFLIEQRTIAPIARGWVKGIPFDSKHVSALHKKMESKKQAICKDLGVTSALLSSPKQKKELLFDKWGCEPIEYTPKGSPSTSAEVLQRLHQQSNDPRFDDLMGAVKLNTIQSKYTNGFMKAKAYTLEDTIYGSPRIFGTYTGRMTYSSKTLKKYQVSIALHQIPRKAKTIKHAMKAPEGYGILAIDANSQELRWMGIQSMDEALIENYSKGLDLHSTMTASIYGRPYDEVVQGNMNGVHDIVEERQSGKLVNLSCQYRIGAPALARKFFSTYQKDIDRSTAYRYLSMHKKQYPGVINYWDEAIRKARLEGYAETVSGRRYNIDKFDWQGESSAINFPIQGSGAEHTYATIGLVNKLFPEMVLALQLHDGLYYYCPVDRVYEIAAEIRALTKTNVYETIFDKELPIALPFDTEIGESFGTLKGVN